MAFADIQRMEEEARLEALARYGVLDTGAERDFDEIARFAASLSQMPIALISLVDRDRIWFKARAGLHAQEVSPVDYPFCPFVVANHRPLVVPDTLADERFATSPAVTVPGGVRFYAGMPLETDDGFVLGTLCVIDVEPRMLELHQEEALRFLAHQVVIRLELGRVTTELQKLHAYVRSQALHDDLTGLRNRRGFVSVGQHELALAARRSVGGVIVSVDVDNLKQINEENGHQAGDEILIDAADLLLGAFRDDDLIARVGGDEFCVLALGDADVIRTRATEHLPESVRLLNEMPGRPARMHLNVGLATFDPAAPATIEDLMTEADLASYAGRPGEGPRSPAE